MPLSLLKDNKCKKHKIAKTRISVLNYWDATGAYRATSQMQSLMLEIAKHPSE